MTIMWETEEADNRVEYWKPGLDPVTVQAEQVPGRSIHFVSLTGLDSNTVYHYRVVTNMGAGVAYRFKTWPAEGDGVTAVKMVAFSDSQGNWPERLQDICDNGIIDKECTDGQAESCPEDIAAVLVTGDLVSSGEEVNQWREEFFGPCRNVFHYVPILPAIGNHDLPIENYLDYFSLPGNGINCRKEQWYSTDLLNLRLITLDSNWLPGVQYLWFMKQLDDTCDDDSKDFVLTQFHHACKSELWLPGQNIQACLFVAWLKAFTRDCGKPSGHLFGHTHAYSRGQSRDETHMWVNVATSAGDIDYWGEYDQKDHDEFQVSYDEYGFVVWHLTTGADPSLRMVRRTGGDDDNYYGYTDETIQDEFSIELMNNAPNRPEAVSPVDQAVKGRSVLLHASAFSDPDGDAHLSSHWQVTSTSGLYADPVVDAWGNETRAENIWGDEDTQAGVDITRYEVVLKLNQTYFWRVRYRDEHFGWSDWSEEATFSTVPVFPWKAASIIGAEYSTTSIRMNTLLLLAAPLGLLLVWKRRIV